MRNNDDLRILLGLLMNDKKLWLFRHHHSRFLKQSKDYNSSADEDCLGKKTKDFQKLLDYKVDTSLDRKLLRGAIK